MRAPARFVVGLVLLFAATLLSLPAASEEPGAAPTPAAKVVAIEGELELNNVVVVTVLRLDEWAKTSGHSVWRLVPYLNGRAMTGMYPVAVDLRAGKLQFQLRNTPETQSAWNNLLTPPTLTRGVRFSIGLEQQDPLDSAFAGEPNLAVLTVMEWEWASAAATLAAAFALAFAWLALTTPILMERLLSPSGKNELRFSLAKVQLALWFFVVFGAFITIWLATQNHDTINSSIVGILGISAGTAFGDSYIRSRREASRGEVRDPSTPADQAPEQAADAECRETVGHKLRHFVPDLISDSDGYSIYRFQMLAWTVALIVVFLSGVYYDLTMPAFRPDLLYLLGVSSGAFVAQRVPETMREVRINPGGVDPASLAKPKE